MVNDGEWWLTVTTNEQHELLEASGYSTFPGVNWSRDLRAIARCNSQQHPAGHRGISPGHPIVCRLRLLSKPIVIPGLWAEGNHGNRLLVLRDNQLANNQIRWLPWKWITGVTIELPVTELVPHGSERPRDSNFFEFSWKKTQSFSLKFSWKETQRYFSCLF